MSKLFLNNLNYAQPQGRVSVSSRFDLDSAFFFPSSPNVAVDLVRGYTVEHPPTVTFVPSDRGIAAKYSGASVVGTPLADAGFGTIVPVTSPFWAVIVFRIESLGTRRTLYSDYRSDGAGSSAAVLFEQTASNTYRWYVGALTPYTVIHSVPVSVGWHVAVIDFTPGGPARMSLDGGAFESSVVGSGVRYNGTRLRAGSAGDLLILPFNGQIETIAVSRLVLTDEVLRSIGSDPWQLFRDDPEILYFDVPAGAATVSADGVLRWSLTSAVQASQALRWSLNALAQRDTTLMWSLLQTAQSDATARWSLIEAINADATLRYSLVQAVQADAALRWSMLEAVAADTTLLWDMAGATGTVSRDFAARWSMLAPVNADAAFHWSLLQAVGRYQTLPWNMVQAIASDAELRWSLIQAVQADADIAWNLVNAVSRDAVLAWDLASSLGTVAASLSLRWSLIAAVQQSINARWSLLASVGADADMRWDMLTGLVAELLARWNVIGRAVADAPLRWDLIAVSETDLVIRWQVGEVFDLVVRKRFVAGASIRREFVA